MKLNEDWKDVEYKKIKEKSLINKIELFFSKDEDMKYLFRSFSIKLFSLPLKFWLYFINIIIIFNTTIFSPFFQTIYISFSSDNSDLHFDNSTYYDIFTEINGGIEYELDKTKLKLSSIFNAVIFIISLSIFFISPILKYINSIIFLVFYFLINTFNFSFYIYIFYILYRLNSSYNKYIYEINRKFAEKDMDIIPFDKINASNYNGTYILFNLVFCIIYYVVIFYIFYAKRNYEKGEYNNAEKNNEKEEKLNP